MSQEIEKEQRIVNSMKSALENHEFVVFYQPKYGLSDNQIAGAEALVRWKHPERGMISPGEFIPVFEWIYHKAGLLCVGADLHPA